MDYVAGLLVVDTFTKKIAVVPIEQTIKKTEATRSKRPSSRWEASRKCYTLMRNLD